MLNEMFQTQRDKCRMVSLMHVSERKSCSELRTVLIQVEIVGGDRTEADQITGVLTG